MATQVQAEKVETARDINIRVASLVMGWTHWDIETGEDCPCESGVTYFADWGEMGGLAVYTPPHSTGDVEYYFNPAEDIANARKVEQAIKARGLWRQYGQALYEEVTDPALRETYERDNVIGLFDFEVADIAHASPEQRCRAALKATEANHD